jgi:hypothetical protein
MFQAGIRRDGFAVARQLFSRREAARYRSHFMALRHAWRWVGPMFGPVRKPWVRCGR